jgi:DNA-binding IclR family transcriptional regulator
LKKWTFLTSHGAVLALIAEQSKIKAIEIASELGITERSVRRIIADLEAAGYIEIGKEGRVNRYVLNPDLPLRCLESRGVKVRALLNMFLSRLGSKKT